MAVRYNLKRAALAALIGATAGTIIGVSPAHGGAFLKTLAVAFLLCLLGLVFIGFPITRLLERTGLMDKTGRQGLVTAFVIAPLMGGLAATAIAALVVSMIFPGLIFIVGMSGWIALGRSYGLFGAFTGTAWYWIGRWRSA
jgi:hypothetical protein